MKLSIKLYWWGWPWFRKWVENSGNVLWFKAGCGPSSRRVGSQRSQNAGIFELVRHLQFGFESFNLSQIPRSRNTHVDSLTTLATYSAQSLPWMIIMEDLCKPTEKWGNRVHIHQIRVGPSWMDSIVLFLKEDILLKGKSEVDKVWRKAPRFWLFEDQKLYKRSFSGPYLLCIHPEVSELLLEELHEGICGSHTRGKSLSHKALT